MREKRLPAPFSVRLALAVVRGYQLVLRPLLTGSCRYLPTCSEYAAEAIVTYGAIRGGWMGLKRVLRCHPLGGSGLDPVPERGWGPRDGTSRERRWAKGPRERAAWSGARGPRD